eukprot:TRINITY_DN17568_c1_g1_i2.p4 TRINITY_DN17568_c1_g1~~TRINITY_DN17568_c1_g1_i2.p4  ORF type:complete len:126 (-),score=8.36 TRINITY_DN17568_c1_g1_i2:51-428(-)
MQQQQQQQQQQQGAGQLVPFRSELELVGDLSYGLKTLYSWWRFIYLVGKSAYLILISFYIQGLIVFTSNVYTRVIDWLQVVSRVVVYFFRFQEQFRLLSQLKFVQMSIKSSWYVKKIKKKQKKNK